MPHYSETGRGMPEEATTVPDTFEGFEAAARHGLKIAFQNGYPFSLRVDVHYDPDNMPKPSKLGAALMRVKNGWGRKEHGKVGEIILSSHGRPVVSIPPDFTPYAPEVRVHVVPSDLSGTMERFGDFIGVLRATMSPETPMNVVANGAR